MSANAIESQLLQNGRFTNPDCDFSRQVGKEVAELWKVDSKYVNMSTPFTTGKMVVALKSIKVDKVPGPNDIHPEFLLHAGDAATGWLSLCVCLFGGKLGPQGLLRGGCRRPPGAWRAQGLSWGLQARLAVVHPIRAAWG